MNYTGTEYIRLLAFDKFFDPTITGTVVVADAIRLYPVELNVPDLEISIARGSDDAGGRNPTGGTTSTCEPENSNLNEIYLGHCPDGRSAIGGFRFESVSIPADATITAARLEFIVDNDVKGGLDDDPLTLQIRGEAGEDPATFTSDSLPSTRLLLDAPAIPWMIEDTETWGWGGADASPDITSLVQAIISQPTWESGDAMVFVIKPTGNGTTARRVFAWERHDNSIQTTKLQIWFTTPPPPAPSGLRVVYHDGAIGPWGAGGGGIGIELPEGYVRLYWSGSGYPSGTTFRVYRSGTGTPVPLNSPIASGLSGTSYWDDYGQLGDWYVVTAKNENGESEPSAPVQAQPPCPEC